MGRRIYLDFGIPWRLIIEACRGLPSITTLREPTKEEPVVTIPDPEDTQPIIDDSDTERGTLGACMPTTEVEVPQMPTRRVVQPVIASGYGYHCRAPEDTDIDDIPEEEWEIVMITAGDVDKALQYRGQRTLDSATVNVWWYGEGEGFFAQVLQGC